MTVTREHFEGSLTRLDDAMEAQKQEQSAILLAHQWTQEAIDQLVEANMMVDVRTYQFITETYVRLADNSNMTLEQSIRATANHQYVYKSPSDIWKVVTWNR